MICLNSAGSPARSQVDGQDCSRRIFVCTPPRPQTSLGTEQDGQSDFLPSPGSRGGTAVWPTLDGGPLNGSRCLTIARTRLLGTTGRRRRSIFPVAARQCDEWPGQQRPGHDTSRNDRGPLPGLHLRRRSRERLRRPGSWAAKARDC